MDSGQADCLTPRTKYQERGIVFVRRVQSFFCINTAEYRSWNLAEICSVRPPGHHHHNHYRK